MFRRLLLWGKIVLAVPVVALLLNSAANGQGEPAKDIYYYYNAYTQAYGAGDYAAYLENLEGAFRLRPEHPGLMYRLAGAHALLGSSVESTAWLDRLAQAGLSYPACSDSDFVSLWGSANLQRLCGRFERNLEPVSTGGPVFSLEPKGLITESVAYHGDTAFISSVRRRKILQVVPGEPARDFSQPSDSLYAVFGLKVDRDRGLLWACTSAVPHMERADQAPESAAAVVAYDLTEGTLKKRAELAPDGSPHVFGDLIVDSQGNLLITDSYAPHVYRLPQGSDTLELMLTLDALVSPQGLTLSSDEKYLYVAGYLNGVCRVDLETREQVMLTHAPDICLFGIDGLYSVGTGLIAVQNGTTPNRVVRLVLNEAGNSVDQLEILEANHAQFAEPTLGVLKAGEFHYIGSSHWGAVNAQGELLPTEELKTHTVFSVPLN